MNNINQILAEGLNALLDKQPELDTAKQYFDGEHNEIYASPAIKRALRKSGTWKLSYCSIPVEAVAERLSVLKITSEHKRAAALLEQVALRNKLDILLTDAIESTLSLGHSYVTVSVTNGNIDIFSLSPFTTHVVYDAENPRQKAYAVRLWRDNDTYRANLYTGTHIHRFKTQVMPSRVQPDTFELIGSSVNPYGEIPIFELQTGKAKQPEHAKGWSAQDAITKSVTAQMSAVDFYSFPLRVALSKNNETSDFGDKDATNAVSAEPGMLTILEGFDSVSQLDSPKPEQYTDPITFYIRQLANLTGTPLSYFGDWLKSNISGEGMRSTESGFYRKCKNRRAYIDAALKDMFAFVLKIKNITGTPQIEWSDIQSQDNSEIWSWRFKAVQAGLPIEQMLLEAGYTTEQVNEWKQAGLLATDSANTSEHMPQPTPSNINVKEKDDNNNDE